MYILDPIIVKSSLKSTNIKSVVNLAKRLDIHRNTVQYYLAGAPVLNLNLEKILDGLNLTPKTAFKKIENEIQDEKKIVIKLADTISNSLPLPLAIVLFGSRAKKTAHRYSDFDIGVYSKDGLSNKDFLKLHRYKDKFEDSSPYLVDLVNLNSINSEFIKNISADMKFLSGSGESWLMLKDLGN